MPFQQLFTIVCRHEYFANQPCRGIQLQLTPACYRVVQRYRLLYRQEGDGSISISKEQPVFGKSAIPNCKEVLEFNLLVSDPSFFSYTSLKPDNRENIAVFTNLQNPDDKALVADKKKREKAVVGSQVLFGHVRIIPPTQFVAYTFSLETPSLCWQYFIVTKNATDHYKVEGAAAGIVFQPVTDASKLKSSPAYQSVIQNFPDTSVYWYQSDTPLPLAQQIRSRIQLINTDTQTILIENLPNPAPADNGVKMIYL